MKNSETIYFETAPFLIGKHEWRGIVIDSWWIVGKKSVLYQWRRIGDSFWQNPQDWPRYDINDTYDGLPKSLEKLYYANEQKIFKALGQPVKNEQFEMEV